MDMKFKGIECNPHFMTITKLRIPLYDIKHRSKIRMKKQAISP